MAAPETYPDSSRCGLQGASRALSRSPASADPTPLHHECQRLSSPHRRCRPPAHSLEEPRTDRTTPLTPLVAPSGTTDRLRPTGGLPSPHALRRACSGSPVSARMLRCTLREEPACTHPGRLTSSRPHRRLSRRGLVVCAGSTLRTRLAHPFSPALVTRALKRRCEPFRGWIARFPRISAGSVAIGDAFDRRLPPTRYDEHPLHRADPTSPGRLAPLVLRGGSALHGASPASANRSLRRPDGALCSPGHDCERSPASVASVTTLVEHQIAFAMGSLGAWPRPLTPRTP